MDFSNKALIEEVPKHNLRAVSRLITLSENNVPRAREVQAALFQKTGQALVVGVTGSPGSGKSTLVDQLARQWRERGKKVAVLAVDPSSPYSGGAILGDRIRMQRSAEDSEIYIRSMASRGSLGGLSRGAYDAIQILDAAGFDLILVETVGVGQAEVDIMTMADTCLVVLVPGMGDSVQSIKAGILEIADLFVINKSDRDGADQLQKDLRILLSLIAYTQEQWKPEIVRTIATNGEGVDALVQAVLSHQAWLKESAAGIARKRRSVRERIIKLAQAKLLERLVGSKPEQLEELVERCMQRELDPHAAVDQLLHATSP